MKKLNLEIEKTLSRITNTITNDLLPQAQRAVAKSGGEDVSFDEIIHQLAFDKVVDYFLEDKNNELARLTKLFAEKTFIEMAQGTEFEKHSGFLRRIKSVLEIGEFYFDIHFARTSEQSFSISVSLYDDTFGSVNDWAVAVLSARKQLRKEPNPKYKDNSGYKKILPILRSYFWKNVVYPSDDFDDTEELRLGFLPEDSAAFIFALETGTGGRLGQLVSEGGFPTPIYHSKGNFLNRLQLYLEQGVMDVVYNAYARLINEIEKDVYGVISKYGIELTSTLAEAIIELSKEEIISILERGLQANINEALGVIINIEERYYEVIKTSSGRLGVRYSLRANRRKRL